MKQLFFFTGLVLLAGIISAQEPLFSFGEEMGLQKIKSGEKVKGIPVQWIQVNTEPETWKPKGKAMLNPYFGRWLNCCLDIA